MAELLGIIFGDGGLTDTQVKISLNAKADAAYSTFVKYLFEELFAIKVFLQKRERQNTLVIVCSSTNLVDFLVQKGAVRGNKISQQMGIPDWVLRETLYSRTFVGGPVDTDGCLYTNTEYLAIPIKTSAFALPAICYP